jgi:Glycerol-3-phosphate acyltransferase C-terminal region
VRRGDGHRAHGRGQLYHCLHTGQPYDPARHIRLGRANLDFGTPIPVRERLAALSSEDPSGAHAVERIALETCHRINRATPVTVTGVVGIVKLFGNGCGAVDVSGFRGER